jgi:hypothetical protein
MEQLIEQISNDYNLTKEEAIGIINAVRNNSVTNNEEAIPVAGNSERDQPVDSGEKEENIFEKATHFVEENLPGELKGKAEEILAGASNKIKSLFS